MGRIGDMKPMTILQLQALQNAILENAKTRIADAERSSSAMTLCHSTGEGLRFLDSH